MTLAGLTAPLRRRRTYTGLLFFTVGLPLGVGWFVLLITLWTTSVAVAFTLLLSVPLVVALGASTRWAGRVERGLADRLLDARIVAPGRLPLAGLGWWAQAKTVLRDRAGWKEQVYLLLRFLVGLPTFCLTVSLAAWSIFVLLAPVFFWIPGGVLDFGIIDIDTFAEGLIGVPLGVIGIVAAGWVTVGLSAMWRGLARGLLGGDPALPHRPAPALAPVSFAASGPSPEPTPPPAPARPSGTPWAERRPVGLIYQSAISALVFLLCTVIWLASTPGGYFWPVWVALPLGLAVGVHSVVWLAMRHVRTYRGLAIHAGVSAMLALFHVAIWLVTGLGYFWPVWVIAPLALAVGVHTIVAYVRRGERIEELTSTRAGAVDAQAAELRRIERDLHDGAQARLVALAMDLGMAEEKMREDPEAARTLVGEARAEARKALVELRDLARGIHPPVLSDRGLAAAVAALADRSPVPVTVTAEVDERPAAAVESAAYFTVAEALTNAAKHSGAHRIDVRLARRGSRLSVEVEDDGAGGADPNGGGLTGLRRRLEALDGRLEVDSPAGGGTRLRAELPCGS